MMAGVQLMVTSAGLDALINAQNGGTDAVRIVAVGLTASAFAMAPTINALPGEFKRITAISGQAVSETILHMTAQDSSADTYALRGFGKMTRCSASTARRSLSSVR